jgi:uncharacterized protein
MPILPTYPGVYVEEIASGVRTITGVSTSVTAFVGSARRGPINRAVRVLNYGAFERNFGGLEAGSYLTYGVRQFFLNGGSEAWIIRLAKNAAAAGISLKDANGADVLELTARDEGKAGNLIEVRVDYATSNPASTFNLTLTYDPADAPSDASVERFESRSMNSKDGRYVVDLLDGSRLVEAKRVAALGGLGAGTSTSGTLDDVGALVDAQHDQFRVSVNGLPAVTVLLLTGTDTAGATATARLTTLCNAIRSSVQSQAGGEPAMLNFTCAPDSGRIKMTSGLSGENSNVRVLPGLTRDLSSRLKLGVANGGVEADAAAAIRPRQIPDPGTLASAVFAADITLPDATNRAFKISLDGGTPETIDLGTTAVTGADLAAKLAAMAALIEQKVREKRPTNAAFTNFVVTVLGGNQLVLASGSRGRGSSVVVTAADANDIADDLKLLSGVTRTPGKEVTLGGGNEEPYTGADEAALFSGSRATRTGIYALEGVDLFNILCLPGVTDPDVLSEAAAYCQERRAFLIVDAPKATLKNPNEMESAVAGTGLPKSNYAAVYYPWLRIADPLKNGKLEDFPPSGTLAGLYARTDSTRGVWKAPAGTEAAMVGVRGISYALSDPENGVLNPLGVNCLRVFPVFGAVAWGARTLRGADEMADEYKYIPVRRTALFIEETLYRSLKWVVFEPNDEPLWSQIRLNVGAFLHSLFRQGAFQGKTPREAYFVKCDSEITTQDDINRGIVNILVGFAPLKPAEFVMIKLQQMAGQLEVG